MVKAKQYTIELWMHAGGFVSTKEALKSTNVCMVMGNCPPTPPQT